MDIDFEGNATPQTGNQPNANNDDTTSLNGGNDNPDITSQDGNKDPNDNPDNGGGNGNSNGNDNNNDNSSTGELEPGSTIEFDGANYTVAENGDIVDAEGNVFKEAKDVADWLKSVDVDNSDSDSEISISAIQEALGITVTDSDGNPIEFTNDAQGVKSYVDSVIDLKSNELQQAAVNKLFVENPLLKQFTDYVQLTGSPRGFGEIPDRSGIILDKDNEEQLKSVIRMAATEFGNKSLNENYIKYLKDTGGLYDEAKNQLQALVEKDTEYRKNIETQAQAQRDKDNQDRLDYWNKVNNVINSRIIAGYKLPESFTKEVDGRKIIMTPNDFYNYLSKASETDADGNTMTGYQRDLNNLSDEDYLNRELLDAWLMFTGGTYKDLIAMAVNEDKVRQLKIKSKENRSAKTVKVIKKQNGKTNINDIVL